MEELLKPYEQIFAMFNVSLVSTAAIAGTVLSWLAAIKKFVPKLQGKASMIAAAVLAILMSMKAYWALPPDGSPDVPAIIVSSIFAWGGAVGIFELIKKASGNGNGNGVKP